VQEKRFWHSGTNAAFYPDQGEAFQMTSIVARVKKRIAL